MKVRDNKTLDGFTGIYDKNTVPIYENDIVIYNYGESNKQVAIVKFDYEFSRFELNADPYRSSIYDLLTRHRVTEYLTGDFNLLRTEYRTDCFEVIGNIHDNPDLLKIFKY